MGAKKSTVLAAAATQRSNAVTVIALGRVIEVAVNKTGLSSTQYRALTLIAAGVTSSGVLAGFLDVRPPTVTTVMNGLVDDGLVDRRRDADDRRKVGYELTPRGAEMLDTANGAAERVLARLADEMDIDDAEVAYAGLEQWRNALDRRRAGR